MDNILKGILIGGAIAGVAGLILAPKPGRELIEDIIETYDSAQKNGADLIDAIKDKSNRFCNLCTGKEDEEYDYHSSLLIGVVVGALVAGASSLLLAPKSGKNMRKMLGNQYDDIKEKAEDFISAVNKNGGKVVDGLHDWKDSLTDLVSKLSNHKSKRNGSSLNSFIDMANIGLNLYHQLQKRR